MSWMSSIFKVILQEMRSRSTAKDLNVMTILNEGIELPSPNLQSIFSGLNFLMNFHFKAIGREMRSRSQMKDLCFVTQWQVKELR